MNCLSFFYMTHQFFSRWAQTLTIRKKRSFRNPPKIQLNFRHWICKNSTFCWFPCIYQSIPIVWTRNNFCYKAWVLSDVKKCLSRCLHPVEKLFGAFEATWQQFSKSFFWRLICESKYHFQKIQLFVDFLAYINKFVNCVTCPENFSTAHKHLLKHLFTLLKTQAL